MDPDVAGPKRTKSRKTKSVPLKYNKGAKSTGNDGRGGLGVA
jgi:hypothetical protein